MDKEYIEQRGGGYYVAGKRISLDSIVYAFQRGAAPESILRSFPLLTLEEVYGAITYYLAHQEQIDAYLQEEEAEFEKMRQASREEHPEWCERLDRARKEALATRP
jgi:uncharacterized protein (DUF433 family)